MHVPFSLFAAFTAVCKVTKVIQTVKDTDDINTVCDGFLYKVLYYIICIWTISKDVLSTEQHLKLCVFETVTEVYEVFPTDPLSGNVRNASKVAPPQHSTAW